MKRGGTLASVVLACMASALPAGLAGQQTRTHAIIVSGIGGEPRYQETFFEWGSLMASAMIERYGVARENVTFLTEQPERDASLTSGRSTKDAVEQAFAAVRGRAAAGDLVFILLIGHGSYQGGVSQLSLPGPDLKADDFRRLVDTLAPRRVVLANVSSASGEFVKAISGPNRIVITATKSGMERNEARFGRHFVAAFAAEGADTDKDGAVSVLEAFEYARRETVRSYEADRALLTEHAVFDDNGDGVGSAEAAAGKDGALARVTFLGSAAVVAGTEAPADASPALRALYEQKREIEKRLEQLRAVKDSMDPARYEQELEKLLVELSLKQQEIRRMEGGSP